MNDDIVWAARFKSKVLDLGLESGCLIWLGGIDSNGYGNFTATPQLRLKAHRAAWLLEFGELPDPHLVLDHRCRNRWCVNPAHLEPVTYSVNSQRGLSNRRPDPALCAAGLHPWAGENIFYRKGSKYATCRACKNQRQREGYARRRKAKEFLDD